MIYHYHNIIIATTYTVTIHYYSQIYNFYYILLLSL